MCFLLMPIDCFFPSHLSCYWCFFYFDREMNTQIYTDNNNTFTFLQQKPFKLDTVFYVIDKKDITDDISTQFYEIRRIRRGFDNVIRL